MKKLQLFLVSAVLCANIIADTTATNVWNGKIESIKKLYKNQPSDLNIDTTNNELSISATSEDKNRVITITVDTTPFTLNENKSIYFNMYSKSPNSDIHTLAIRGLNAKNKIVFSFYTLLPVLNMPRPVELAYGKSGNFRCGQAQINADKNSEVVKLLILVRADKPNEKFNVTFSDFKVGKSSLNNVTEGSLAYSDGNLVLDGLLKRNQSGIQNSSCTIPFTGDLNNKALSFVAKTNTPDLTNSFYVIAYNKDNQAISYHYKLRGILNDKEKTFTLIPQKNCQGMVWNGKRIKKTTDQNITHLKFIIGSLLKNSKISMNYDVEIKDIKLVDIKK